jgi:hypothetical protein
MSEYVTTHCYEGELLSLWDSTMGKYVRPVSAFGVELQKTWLTRTVRQIKVAILVCGCYCRIAGRMVLSLIPTELVAKSYTKNCLVKLRQKFKISHLYLSLPIHIVRVSV